MQHCVLNASANKVKHTKSKYLVFFFFLLSYSWAFIIWPWLPIHFYSALFMKPLLLARVESKTLNPCSQNKLHINFRNWGKHSIQYNIIQLFKTSLECWEENINLYLIKPTTITSKQRLIFTFDVMWLSLQTFSHLSCDVIQMQVVQSCEVIWGRFRRFTKT